MGDANNDDTWDEWGEENGVSSPHAAPSSPPPSRHDTSSLAFPSSSAPTAAAAVSPDVKGEENSTASTTRAVLDWAWDLAEIEADLQALSPSIDWSLGSQPPQDVLGRLAALAQPTCSRLHELHSHTDALRAQARVTLWSLRRLHTSLQPDDEAPTESDYSNQAIHEELQLMAGDWGTNPRSADSTTTQQVQEMSSLLQHALLACDGDDLTPFQLALEQLFSSFPHQSLHIPTSWIRSVSHPQDDTTPKALSAAFDTYLRRLVEIWNLSDGWVDGLSDAQMFQDAKDIQRDELVVNGEAVVGSIGYDAIVTKIQVHVQQAIATLTGDNDKSPTQDTNNDNNNANEVSLDTTRNVAAQVLNAINRTESGGCSYEILSQFVSQHTMDHVLIRPASAKAPPLEITLDLGPFCMPTKDDGGINWSFGLRVRVSAVTWYCICDANDPTHEFYDVQTTYSNRLAFPLGLAPLSSATLMRRDSGVVTVTLHTIADGQDESAHDSYKVADSEHTSMDQHSGDTIGDVDFDALM